MRWFAITVFVILAVLGLIWLVNSCQEGKSPVNEAVDSVEEAVDDVRDAVR